ncbi:hypothetical protein [Aliivibrio fischeri]|uniref:hypothetical protein n=1 Tax=Aliivibrio fischeri TaxID=668 RepID=UPI0007C55403|nr:hypothetical protein [Aliivibrio fischeri]
MSSFKHFLSSSSKNAMVCLNAHKKEVALTSSKLLLATAEGTKNITNTQAKNFANELSELVHSESFINELSEKLPDPKLANSKPEYVDNAKAEMKALLMKKLTK